jgi:4-hydroxybenzoate polyprenyltransferase
MIAQVKNYLSLIKFSHTIFAMPFALIGFFLAVTRGISETDPSAPGFVLKFTFVIFCMVMARSAAMAFNRYLDWKFDAMNPRTAGREIPSGIITPGNALTFTIINCLMFIVCTYLINPVCFYLSPVALFIILFYSYTKRFTPLCHLVLGIGLSLAPIGAYLAVTGTFALLPVLFSIVVLLWVSGFDIIYALQDEEFDRLNMLHSIPAAAGKKNALIISRILHFLCGTFVVVAGIYGNFGIWYLLGSCIFIAMLGLQQSIVKHDDLRRVNIAFMTANGFASILFSLFVVLDLFLN